jgi:hypothetical protein
MREHPFLSQARDLAASLKPLEDDGGFNKDDLMKARVSLPIAPGVCVQALRVVEFRLPFTRRPQRVVVDASLLPAR